MFDKHRRRTLAVALFASLVCFSGNIHRLSLLQHSLYVGVVEKPPPPPPTGEQYGKMEPKYPEGGRCLSLVRPQWVFNVSFIILIIRDGTAI